MAGNQIDNRIRSMDLLRSLAIFMVLLAHAIFSFNNPIYLDPLQIGGIGVDLFFVLSGWLLGGQLFKEMKRTKKIDIRRFWARRWMRTLPAYYVVLLLSFAQQYLFVGNHELPWRYVIFIQNYDTPLRFFTISWSLALEEQFYLFIAPLLALLATQTRRRILLVLLCLLLLPFAFRLTELYGSVKESHVRLDGCLMGVLLAFLRVHYSSIWERLCSYALPMAVSSMCVLLLFVLARYAPTINLSGPDKLLLAFIFGFWVVLANSSIAAGRRMYFPGAHYVATRSYSMYLLHPEAYALVKPLDTMLPFPVLFVIALAVTAVLSEILYRVVELPFMKYRDKKVPSIAPVNHPSK